MNLKEDKPYSKPDSYKRLSLKVEPFISPNNNSKKECGCPDITVLKLRNLNLSSQNHNLKRKLIETEQALDTVSSYKTAFDKAIKVTKKLMLNQGIPLVAVQTEIAKLTTKDSNLSYSNSLQDKNTRKSEEEQNKDLIMKSTIAKKGGEKDRKRAQDSKKSVEHEYLRRIKEGDEKQTVKSLDFSLESRSSIQSQQTKKQEQLHQQDFFQLREEYESSRQTMQSVYNMKIELLSQEIRELKRQNQALRKQVEHTTINKHGRTYEQEQSNNFRQTAYFSASCEPISQRDEQESIIAKSQPDLNAQELNNTFHKLYQTLKGGATEVVKVLDYLYQLQGMSKYIKLVNLDEYMNLIESKKQQAIYRARCKALQWQLSQTKAMIQKSL